MVLDIVALCLSFFLMYFLIRGVNRLYLHSALSKRKRKKIKSKNFIDWFLLKEYIAVLPKIRIIWYFLNFVFLFVSIVGVVLCHLLNASEMGGSIVWSYFVINGLWVIAAYINIL